MLHFERQKIEKEREELARKRQHLEMERKRAEFQAVKRPMIEGHGRSPDNFHSSSHHGSRRGDESHSSHARPVVESSRYYDLHASIPLLHTVCSLTLCPNA